MFDVDASGSQHTIAVRGRRRQRRLAAWLCLGGWPMVLLTPGLAMAGDPLAAILDAPIVRCDVAPWTLLGISLAGFNFLISTAGALAVFTLLPMTVLKEINIRVTVVSQALPAMGQRVLFVLGQLILWAFVAVCALSDIALIALAVGAVIALAPLVTIWGAIAIVVGVLLIGVALLVWSAAGDGKALVAMFSAGDDA